MAKWPSLPDGPRDCPDCGSPRLVGSDDDNNSVWSCSGPCPPLAVQLVGTLDFDGDVPMVDEMLLVHEFMPFRGKKVLVTLHVYGEAKK